MKKEKSAGAIIFRIERRKSLYLLLHYPSSAKSKSEYWDLPKGHIEKGETEEETVKREVREETGLQGLKLFTGFREEIRYWFRFEQQTISKTVAFYLLQTTQKEITISSEHVGFQWLPYKEALDVLTYQNARTVLQKAHHFLSPR